ncbi:MAG: TlpA disulfide reductase family protein [Syntrophales bacterium]|nr:TlpA disulfide reductase family protein [Syntrophales bacterium]
MKRSIVVLTSAILFLVATAASAGETTKAPEVGQEFPNISLPFPEARAHRDYLGLQRGNSFGLSQVKAEVVIVEILSMYCPFCQAEAPKVNELYAMIENDEKLRGKVKIIGIAAGNTALETDLFRKKYDVPFPLFADGDFVLHKAFGEVRTPYFIGARIVGDRAMVFHSRLGAFDDPASFLSLILEESGLQNAGGRPE